MSEQEFRLEAFDLQEQIDELSKMVKQEQKLRATAEAKVRVDCAIYSLFVHTLDCVDCVMMGTTHVQAPQALTTTSNHHLHHVQPSCPMKTYLKFFYDATITYRDLPRPPSR